MSGDAPKPIRVLLDDQEHLFKSLDEIVVLAQQGRIDANTRVSMPDSDAWLPAGSIPALADHLRADLWAAWDRMDDHSVGDPVGDGSAVSGAPDNREASPDGHPAVAPESEDTSDARSVPEELPVEAVRPMAPKIGGRMVVETPRRKASNPAQSTRTGQVIAFPSSGAGAAAAVASLPSDAVEDVARVTPDPAPLPVMDFPPIPQQQQGDANNGLIRWWRVALLAGVAISVTLLAQWYITTTATAVFPPPRPPSIDGPPTPRVVDGAAARPTPAPAPPSVGPYDAIEAELRARMIDSPRDITADGHLEDALLIELNRLEVLSRTIEAPILTWAGRRNDVPQSAEIHIRYRSEEGALPRELAAVGLVVGRYIHTYALDVPVLDIVIERDGKPLQRLSIPPDAAQRFYIKRLDMEGFVGALLRGG